MSALDPPYALDGSGMLGWIEGAPAQIDAAVAQAAERPWRWPGGAPELLAAGGMGGSAIGAELAIGFEAERLPRPALVVRNDAWPACVTPQTLAVLASYSGTTEETLALDDEAASRGVPRVAIATGGELAARCDGEQRFWWRLPPGMSPRAALWSSWPAWSFLLAALGWCPDPAGEWREAARLLERRRETWGPDVPEAENLAKRIARRLHDHAFLVVASAGRGAAAALRWRHQLHENAKLLGHSTVVPEFDHNEIVGWERPGALSGRVVSVWLRDREDAAAATLRMTSTREFLEQQGAETIEASEAEGGRLSRLAALVYLGDWVSFYAAMLHGVDPTPIASIAAFKRRLKEAKATHAG